MCEDDKIRECLKEILIEGPDYLQFSVVSIVANLVDKDHHGFVDRQGLLEASGVKRALQKLSSPNNNPLCELVRDALEGLIVDIS